jgi:cell division protein FtsN
MNKIWLLGIAACALVAFNSCKPKQSTYRAAYEQAQQRNDTASDGLDDFADDDFAAEDDLDVTPVSKPATTTTESTSTATTTDPGFDINESLNYATRQEQINPYPYQENSYDAASGFKSLKRYNVVIGSFRNRTNAGALRERMQYEGYAAQMVANATGMLRVIVASSDNKSEAVRLRDQFRSKHYPNFQDAWILEQKY